ncbi:hypothetical protein OSTOST_09708 [Ostertagia ostertagi]
MGDSVVIDNGLQLAVIDSNSPSNFEVIYESETMRMVLSLRCVEEPDDHLATLLSSPRKLISHGASQITQKGFAFLNNAVSTAKDIGANSDVPYILEDAWNKMNIKDDLGSLLQNVVDIVDQADDGTFFTQRDEVRPSTVSRLPDHAYGKFYCCYLKVCSRSDVESLPEAIEEPVAINVVRKEKGVRRKRLSHSESHEISDSHYDDTISIDENTLLALRRQVLGDAFVSDSPCMSGVSINSTPTWSSRDSPKSNDHHMQSEEQNVMGVSSSPKDEPSAVMGTPSPEHDQTEQNSRDDGLTQTDEGPRGECEQSENVVDSPKESVQGAESVTVAYEYLLQQNSPQTSSTKYEVAANNVDAPCKIRSRVSGERSRRNLVLNDRVDIWTKVDAESIIWMVRRNVGFCATETLSTTTRFDECAVDGGGVTEVSVGNNSAWYITKEGVSLQMELPEKAIFSKVDRDWPLVSISASEQAVWAIRADTGGLVVRVGLHRCKMGLDWVEIVPEGTIPLSVSLRIWYQWICFG